MYIGDESGCHEVPEPVWPRRITLLTSEPILIPMPSSEMTSKDPVSPSLAGIFIPGICPDVFEGEAAGEGAGICIPGICPDGLGDAPGAGARECVGGEAAGEGEGAGIFIPGIWLSCAAPHVKTESKSASAKDAFTRILIFPKQMEKERQERDVWVAR